jgi:hypothetical protein
MELDGPSYDMFIAINIKLRVFNFLMSIGRYIYNAHYLYYCNGFDYQSAVHDHIPFMSPEFLYIPFISPERLNDNLQDILPMSLKVFVK